MDRRLWSNPPLKPDGTLDYARLTLAEICQDLTESLLDMVTYCDQKALVPFLDRLPDAEEFPVDGTLSPELVGNMENLLQLENSDPNFLTPATRDVIERTVIEIQRLTRNPG